MDFRLRSNFLLKTIDKMIVIVYNCNNEDERGFREEVLLVGMLCSASGEAP